MDSHWRQGVFQNTITILNQRDRLLGGAERIIRKEVRLSENRIEIKIQ